MTTRRHFLSAVLGATALAGLPGAAWGADDFLTMPWDKVVEAAKAEGELTFYAWWGEEFWRTAAKDFEAKHGIKVTVVTGDRVANIGKVLSEASSSAGTIDALLVGGVELKSLLDAKALYGPLVGVIPNSDKLDPNLSKIQEGYATEGRLVPVYRNQTGLVYDPDKVPTPPQTWAEFITWLDANPGKFAFNDPSKGGSGQAFVQAAIANILGDEAKYQGDTEMKPEKVADWGKVWDWFNANESKFTITSSNNDSLDRVNQGEVLMAAAWDDDTAVSLSKGTLFKRAKLYIPEFGMPGGGDSLGIPANAPHKAAAMLFIAYLIEADVQKQLNTIIGSYLARVDVSGDNALIPDEQRLKSGRPWLPGAYKKHFIEQFVAEVLQK
ncbi:MAG TPA: extracellular solute-binding protein [Aestuariivirga sp.]|nr:extracellular solute-binding protein [Aestuariivirga sp.]